MKDNLLTVKIDETNVDGNSIISGFEYAFNSQNIYVLLGKNGSGKTTLYRIISGLEKRFSGYIKLNNSQVEKPSKKIQIVFQDNRLFPWKTVYKNLKFVSPKISKKEAKNILNEYGLSEIFNSYPKKISGGEESRVSLLLTFLNPPDVLLLDEPFTGLDINSQKNAIEETRKLKSKNPSTLIILITHNLLIGYELADKILILDNNTLQVNNEIDKKSVSSIKELENEYEKYATQHFV